MAKLMQIFCAEALATLKQFPNNSAHVVICDPPYGVTQNKWDSVIPLNELWEELARVCLGAVVFTAVQPFSSTLVASRANAFKHEFIWYKNKGSGHLNCRRAPIRYHESVLVFAEGGYTFNPQMTEGHRPGNYAKRVKHSTNYGEQRTTIYGGQTTRYPRSVQEFAVVNNDSPDRAHPTQKPVELMGYLVKTYSNPGDVVLDFAMGSGTTGVAAILHGRRFIGIEKDAGYFAAAKQRLEAIHDKA